MSTYKAVKEIEEAVVGGVVEVTNPAAETSLATIAAQTVGYYGHEIAVRSGTIPGGTTSLTGNVINIDMGDERTLATGLIDSERITFDTTRSGVAMRISSTSANDEQTAGTGNRRLSVRYVDENGDAQTTLVYMNGQSAGNWDTAAGPTTKLGIAINGFTCVVNGSLGTSDGTIYGGPDSATWASGKPDEIFCLVEPGPNISRMGAIYGPNDETYYPCNMFLTTTASAGEDVEIATQYHFLTGAGTNLMFENARYYIGEGDHIVPLSCARIISPGNFFEVVARNHNGNNIDASLQVGLIDVPTS